jgi:hypothetical protein
MKKNREKKKEKRKEKNRSKRRLLDKTKQWKNGSNQLGISSKLIL